MLHLRSPLLHRMPGRYRRTTRTRLLLRWVLVLAIIFVVLLVVLLIQRRLLPADSSGRLLYQLHDDLFLPLRGHLYTRWLPLSAIVWGIGLTILGLNLLSWLFGGSLIRAPHLWLLRRRVQQPARHQGLLRWARIYRQLGVRPHLLRLMVLDEYERALEAIRAAPPGQGNVADSQWALQLWTLALNLDPLFAPDAMRSWRMVARWHDVLLLSHVHLPSVDFQALWPDFDAGLARLPLPTDTSHATTPFHAQAITAMLRDVVALAHVGRMNWSQPAHPIDTHPPNADAPQREPAYQVAQRLVTNLQIHQHTLEIAAHHFQGRLLGQVNDAPRPLPHDDMRLLPIMGLLSLHLAIHAAYTLQQSHRAAAYLAAWDSLALVVRAVPATSGRLWGILLGDEQPGRTTTGDFTLLQSLDAYRLTSWLVDAHIDDWQAAWQHEWQRRDGLLTDGDFQTARLITSEALLQAAGEQV